MMNLLQTDKKNLPFYFSIYLQYASHRRLRKVKLSIYLSTMYLLQMAKKSLPFYQSTYLLRAYPLNRPNYDHDLIQQ